MQLQFICIIMKRNKIYMFEIIYIYQLIQFTYIYYTLSRKHIGKGTYGKV